MPLLHHLDSGLLWGLNLQPRILTAVSHTNAPLSPPTYALTYTKACEARTV